MMVDFAAFLGDFVQIWLNLMKIAIKDVQNFVSLRIGRKI